MEREIEYRCWCPKDKKMYEVLNICFFGAKTVTVQYNPVVKKRLDEVYLMQFTGLLDKNGKKIFEGDEILYSDFTNVYKSDIQGVVVFWKGVFGVKTEMSNKVIPLHFNEDFYTQKTVILSTIHDQPISEEA